MSDSTVFPTAKAPWPRRRRMMAWTIAAILVGSMVFPLSGYVYVAVSDAYAQQQNAAGASSADKQTNPRANYWRAVRQGYDGYTAASGPYTTNVLIQNGGQNWRQLRNGPASGFSAWILAIVVGAIVLFTIVRGRIKLRHAATSGKTVERWSLNERVLHWYVAVLFIVLSITGLSMLFGREVLIPLLGYAGFGVFANVAIALHNYLGPFFVIGVLLEIIIWFRDMLPEATDWEWLRRGGGFFSKNASHPSAGRVNAGEKYLTYWLGLVLMGGAVSVTGIMMDFPIFSQVRETMQVSNLIHGIAGIIWISLTLGHIYLGAWSVEGALSGVTNGRVSSEWAREHHDLWYEREGRKTEATGDQSSRAASRTA
ncbi:MAG TPA: formate dehydrogenase subunit gamma [Burkholderiales bacterium]